MLLLLKLHYLSRLFLEKDIKESVKTQFGYVLYAMYHIVRFVMRA